MAWYVEYCQTLFKLPCQIQSQIEDGPQIT